MPTNEAEVPPERLWLPLEAALLLRGDEHGPHEIEYVPASALSGVWDEAIAVMHATPREALTGLVSDALKHDRLKLIYALEAARDAALNAGKGATNEEVGR